MNDINTLYNNDYGIAFQWKKGVSKDLKRVQLVFRNTGMFLNHEELLEFHKEIDRIYNMPKNCRNCIKNRTCNTLLLQTPCPQISFALNYKELLDVQDLVKGTLIQLELNLYLIHQNINTKN